MQSKAQDFAGFSVEEPKEALTAARVRRLQFELQLQDRDSEHAANARRCAFAAITRPLVALGNADPAVLLDLIDAYLAVAPGVRGEAAGQVVDCLAQTVREFAPEAKFRRWCVEISLPQDATKVTVTKFGVYADYGQHGSRCRAQATLNGYAEFDVEYVENELEN